MPDIKSNKRIAKNAVLLYSRMLLIMFVALYTSRVTLRTLGEEDYGIYQLVCGTVTFLSFLSNALANGMARFLTFEMGKQKPRLEDLFATVKTANIVLGIVVVVVGEVLGLWLIHNKIIIAPERMEAAIFAFHFSMLATFFQIVQSPYNAIIIAYEYMDVYAYISILDATLKLLIVYCLILYSGDQLKAYSVLIFGVTVIIWWVYYASCRKKIKGVKYYRLSFDVGLFRNVAGFSGWNLFSSSAASIANQGVTIVAGMFFEPTLITVRALALKVSNIINSFINSFRTAVNPQIVKRYSAGEYDESKKLALLSAQYTYYLVLVIVCPLSVALKTALAMWLGEVPEGLAAFVQLTLVQALFQALDTSLYIPIYAKGQIKENAIISPLFDFVQLPIVYFLFKRGANLIALAWVGMLAYAILGIIVKPILVHKVAGYKYNEIAFMLGRCLIVTVLASAVTITLSVIEPDETLVVVMIKTAISTLAVIIAVYYVGIDRNTRCMINGWIRSRFKS